jgi:putative ABC transport system substrate-binding protein
MGIAEGDPEGRVWVSAFRKGLEEAGWVEGRNLRLDLRWPSGDTSIMRAQAAELVNQHPDVIVTHATPATIALRHETRAVPNVFVVVADPVGSGFVESFPRPGQSVTSPVCPRLRTYRRNAANRHFGPKPDITAVDRPA